MLREVLSALRGGNSGRGSRGGLLSRLGQLLIDEDRRRSSHDGQYRSARYSSRHDDDDDDRDSRRFRYDDDDDDRDSRRYRYDDDDDRRSRHGYGKPGKSWRSRLDLD